MQDFEGLAFDQAGGIARITLNRPEKLNALLWSMITGITDWVTALGEDPAVRVIVITGAGRAFSSGDDIMTGMRGAGAPESPADQLARTAARGPHYRMIKALMSAPKPVIAALNGRTHGAGWVLALACDFRVARDDVLIGDIRSGRAIYGNQGAGLMLPHLIGASRAMDLLITGRVIEAAEAERFGIIQRLWPAADWDRELEAFVHDLAVGPTRNYAAWKASVNRAVLLELDAYTDHENLLNVALSDSADNKEGMASFRERRDPVFTGH
jgi:2-(1,2-epoxy-1,2-dihydrophenyl)acetyl-CoA isomerase